MKRNSFNVLFFIKKAKLQKNGEASVCICITVNGARVETNISKSIANEWITKDPFVGIKFHEKEVAREFLTMDELLAISLCLTFLWKFSASMPAIPFAKRKGYCCLFPAIRR